MTQKCVSSSTPAYHNFEEFQTRLDKLEEIKALGISPYPHSFKPTTTIEAIQDEYKDNPLGDSEQGKLGKTPEVTIGGRLVLFRAMGKNAFGQILSGNKRLQVMFNRDVSEVTGLKRSDDAPIRPIKFIEKKLDLGDILGLTGHLFRTGKGELTLFVKQVTLLTKALLPLPEKHAGINDLGVLYRKRWLDLLTNPTTFNNIKLRSDIIRETRRFMDQKDFMEVETPVLQNIYGGAEAAPFVTHLNALNSTMYMRIALEIALKKLVVGGLERVYEIGKVFRNEGIDKTHNPEFTMMEAYGTYLDYNDIMVLTENLFAHLATKLFGSTRLEDRLDKAGNVHTIDLKTPWIRMTMKDAIKKYGEIDVNLLSDEETIKKRINLVNEHIQKDIEIEILIPFD
ncbi:lysine--tRNA ligase, partial [Candidatus Aerophobetes bacterium]